MRRTTTTLLLIAGTLVPAIAASGDAGALAILPTTSTTAPPTTTTTEAEATTTTTAPDDPSATTTTTAAPEDEDEVTSTTTEPEAEAELEEEAEDLLEGGGLSISVPDGAVLSPGTAVGAGALSAALGAVTVTDDRGGLVAGWAVTVSATDFVTGGSTPAETIPRGNVAYWSGPPTDTSGTGPFVPGQLTALLAEPLSAPVVAFTSLGPIGASSATWVPTLIVTFPATAAVGQYVGTITHSVA